ncbi:internal scaffolding protein [robinz microvirus RP_36]|nr:internal scaffolding protein [robinz microvirus RP_36]
MKKVIECEELQTPEALRVFVRSPYNYDRLAASRASGLECRDKSRTVQSQKEEADINVTLRRFGVTGMMPPGIELPNIGDYDGVFDFQTAQQTIRNGKESFNRMPAHLRSRFQNDPQKFYEFCMIEENRDEMVKLGFIDKQAEPPTVDVAPPPEEKTV